MIVGILFLSYFEMLHTLWGFYVYWSEVVISIEQNFWQYTGALNGCWYSALDSFYFKFIVACVAELSQENEPVRNWDNCLYNAQQILSHYSSIWLGFSWSLWCAYSPDMLIA